MEINYIEVLICILLASFGGLVKRMTELEKHPEKKATPQYYVAGSLISTFVGIVVYILCKNFDVQQHLTAGLTALAGYVGVPVLDFLSEIAKKRLEKGAGTSGGDSQS